MLILPILVIVGVGLVGYWAYQQYAVAHAGPGAHPPPAFVPRTSMGKAAIWVLIAGVLVGLALMGVSFGSGAPLGAVAFVLAAVARFRDHDHSLALLFPLVGGFFLAVIPILFVLGSGLSG